MANEMETSMISSDVAPNGTVGPAIPEENEPKPSTIEVNVVDHEELVVLPDAEREEVVSDTKSETAEADIPEPSEHFRQLFGRIVPAFADPTLLDRLCQASWKQYYESSQHVVLEGSSNAWIACAIYCCMIQRRTGQSFTYPFQLAHILDACGISPLEFFDRLDRWVDIIGATKRMRDHVLRIQSTLAVSAVVYKKLVPIYRRLFVLIESSASNDLDVTSSQLLSLIWNMFLVIKKSLPSEDLLSCFHLMLCVVETVYEDVIRVGADEHINQEFASILESCSDSESDSSLLEYLCKSFEGVVLDAKHFRIHWYNVRKDKILDLVNPADIVRQHVANADHFNMIYESVILKRGELDERLFLPKTAASVFDEAFDCSAVELLRRSKDDSSFADAELLLRMSTQSCLEKLADHRILPTPLTAKSYIISSEALCPLTPLSSTLQNPAKLASLIPPGFTLQGSLLAECCLEMRDNPLPTIALSAENFGQRFADRVNEETRIYGESYDATISQSLKKNQELVIQIFYILMEKIARVERQRNPSREMDFCNVFRKEEFLASVFSCALELVLFSYQSVRAFPWSVSLFNLPPISFHKVIEVIIRAELGLSREMVKHLNRKEEEVLELHAWALDSPIWIALGRRADQVPSCDSAWNINQRNFVSSYSPVKRRKVEDGSDSPANAAICTATTMFFRKVYYVACVRLSDLCERIRMDERGRRMTWTALEHVMRTETDLLKGRHLDQNLLCIVYVVAKSLKMSCTFMDIMSHYRHQPQSRSQVYREVIVDASFNSGSSEDGNSRDSTSCGPKLRCASTVLNSNPGTPEPCSEKVDLIMYYNKVFLPRLKEFMRRLDNEDPSIRVFPMPSPKGFGLSPVKRGVTDRVTVVPLSSAQIVGDRLKYNIQNSPRKDLHAINRMVNLGQPPFFSVAEVPNKASVFGTLYRR